MGGLRTRFEDAINCNSEFVTTRLRVHHTTMMKVLFIAQFCCFITSFFENRANWCFSSAVYTHGWYFTIISQFYSVALNEFRCNYSLQPRKSIFDLMTKNTRNLPEGIQQVLVVSLLQTWAAVESGALSRCQRIECHGWYLNGFTTSAVEKNKRNNSAMMVDVFAFRSNNFSCIKELQTH